MSKEVFSLLLQDAAFLLQPKKVVEVKSVPTTDDNVDLRQNASLNALRVLSDIASLYGEPPAKNDGAGSSQPLRKPSHVVHKLLFYAAYVLGTPAPMLRVLADEAAMRAKTLESEGKRGQVVESETVAARIVKSARGSNATRTPRIEEL